MNDDGGMQQPARLADGPGASGQRFNVVCGEKKRIEGGGVVGLLSGYSPFTMALTKSNPE